MTSIIILLRSKVSLFMLFTVCGWMLLVVILPIFVTLDIDKMNRKMMYCKAFTKVLSY